MRFVATLATGGLLAISVAALSAPAAWTPGNGDPINPGKDRWAVKSGTDADVDTVFLQPKVTTVEALAAIRRPSPPLPAGSREPLPQTLQTHRVKPVETHTYTVPARITAFRLERDGSYHLVLQGDSGETMIARIIKPRFILGYSPLHALAALVRQQFQDFYRLKEATVSDREYRDTNLPVRITGVGYWERVADLKGAAPNGLELQPVLAIEWPAGAGFGTPK